MQETGGWPFYMKKDHVAERDDRWLEQLLRRQAAADRGVEVSGACLDADTLAAWADGALTSAELATAQAHASTCPRCLSLLAAIERTAPPVPAERHRRKWLVWLVPLTAAATAVAIWVAIPGQQVTTVPREMAATSQAPLSPPPTASSDSPVPPAGTFAPPPPVPVVPEQPRAFRDDNLSRRNLEAREERKAAPEDARADAALGAAAARDRTVPSENSAAAQTAPAAPPPAALEVLESLTVNQSQRSMVASPVIESAAPGGVVRWRVVGSSAVERSLDSGKTWARASTPPGVGAGGQAEATITAIQATDAARAAVTLSDGRRLATTDGGATWAPVQEKPAAPF